MQKGFLRLVFLLFLFCAGTCFSARVAAEQQPAGTPPPPSSEVAPGGGVLADGNPAGPSPSSGAAGGNASSASAAVSASVPAEKLFYKLSLNETFFIRKREAMVNAVVSVEILQGEPDVLSLEIRGAGEVVGVSGDNVADWSIRRQGTRSFLEIRPKALNGQKKFKLIVMGKQALKLPTTISPLIFSGVDSAAFTGIVRFLSSVDFRLYAKQERGLIPLGARSRNEINYLIQGAEPSLRLDVASANDLLEAVSLDDFSLRGEVEPASVRFHLKGKAHVREAGAEVVVLTGDAALVDFPEKSSFVVLAKTSAASSGQTEYLLRFPSRGEFDVELTFDAGIKSKDGWQHLDFGIPVAQVAPFSLRGMPADTVFSADNISLPQPGKDGEFSGFLPSSGKLDLRWRPSLLTPPEFSSGIYSVDTATEMQLTTGVLKQCSEFDFTISQGEISSFLFELGGEGEILDVSGQDLVAWSLVARENGRRGLLVRLSHPKSGKYRLRVESQTRTEELPKTLSPIRLVPAEPALQPGGNGAPFAICVRNNELLRLRSGAGVRCEALPQPGLAQIVPGAFPQERKFFEKTASEDEEISVYRLSSGSENLRVRADFVRAEMVVNPRARWLFSGEKITSVQTFSFEVSDAPAYGMQILVPAECEIVALNSSVVASHEISEDAPRDGYRLLSLVFSEPVLGAAGVSLTLQQPATRGNAEGEEEGGSPLVLRPCLFPQAHFVFGEMGLSCPKNVRLLPLQTENLTEIAPAEYSAGNPPQLAFRLRQGEWRLSVRSEERAPALGGESVCIYKIGDGKIYGNFKVQYSTGGVPVGRVRLAFPQEAKVLSLSGDGVREWSVDAAGEATVLLSEETSEDFSLVASFEEPRREGEMQAFEGVRLMDVCGERGQILLTADRVLALSGEESVRAMAALPLQDVREDFARFGGAILFRAYQFVERPFRLRLETHLPEAKQTPKLVVSEARITANADESCSVVYRLCPMGAPELNIAVPAGWKINFDGARLLADGETTALPLPENATEIAFRMERVERVAGAGSPVVAELPFPRVFAPVARTVFVGFGDAKSETLDVVASGRWLKDVLDASFARRFFSIFREGLGVFIPSILILAVALGAAKFFKKRKKPLARACLAVAVAAGTMLSISVVWWLVETVRPEYGDAVLMAGWAEPGAEMSVSLRRFYFAGTAQGGNAFPPAFFVAAFFVGEFLLLFGSAFWRWLSARVAGRVLLYASLAVFAVEDFPYRVPAFVVAAFAVEISAFVARALVRIFGEKTEARPPAAAGTVSGGGGGGGSAVALFAAALLVPAASFPLPAEAAEQGEDGSSSLPGGNVAVSTESVGGFSVVREEGETPHDVADRIAQAIDVRQDRIIARGDIRVSGVAGDRFDLLSSPAVLTSFEKTQGSMLRLERRRAENAEVVYQVVLERAGTFSANFSYEFALAENARSFPILTGAAAADVASVRVSRAEVQISAAGAVSTSVSAVGEKAQIAQIVFKPKASREVNWNPRERDRSLETPRVFVSGENLYVPAPGLVEGFHALKFMPAQGEISRVRIKIPKPFSVSRLEGAAIHRWNFNRDSGVLTVLFTAPRVSAFSLSVFTQAQLGALPVSQKFSALETPDFDVQVRTIGIATGEDVQVDSVSFDGLSAIDEDEYVSELKAAGLGIGEGKRLRRAFKSVGKAGAFSAELSLVRPNLQIESQETFYVNSDSLREKIEFSATASRAEVFRLAFRLPAGMAVDAIRGDALGYWTKEPATAGAADGSTMISLHLKRALEGQSDFEVLLSGAFPRDEKEWSLPAFSIEGAKIQRGEIRVHVDEGLRLKPVHFGGTTMMPAGTESDASGEEDSTFAFRYFNRSGEMPKFTVLDSRPWTTATWLHRVDAFGRFARSRVEMTLEIENVMRTGVQVRVPENACAVRFFGEELAGAEKVAGTPDLWEVKFFKPLRGKVPVSLEFFTEIPLEPSVSIVPVSVVDADRETAWLAVKRDGVFTALRSHSPERVSESDVPEALREALSGGGGWFVEKYAEKYPAELAVSPAAVSAWRAGMADEHQDSFRVETLARSTVFSNGGALTEDRFLVAVSRSDLLRIKLPAGGALRAVEIDGHAVPVVEEPAAEGEEGSASVFLPVFFRAGKTVPVSVLYEHPVRALWRGGQKVLQLVPAEILSAERTTWQLRSRAGRVEVLDIFGRSPDPLRVAVPAEAEGPARFLGAYFGGAESPFAPAEALRSVAPAAFAIAGTDILAPSAVVSLRVKMNTGGDSDLWVFVALFVALLLVKGAQWARRWRKSKQ